MSVEEVLPLIIVLGILLMLLTSRLTYHFCVKTRRDNDGRSEQRHWRSGGGGEGPQIELEGGGGGAGESEGDGGGSGGGADDCGDGIDNGDGGSCGS